MRVLVTGGNGFIGSAIVRKLFASGHKVRAMIQPGTSIDNLENLNVEKVIADLRSISDIYKAVQEQDAIIHLAAKVSDWGKREDFLEINFKGTSHLLKEAVKAGVKKFCFMSSLAVHKFCGNINGDENTPRDNFKFYYAESKILAEDEVNNYFKEKKLDTTIIRPGALILGPRDHTTFVPLVQGLKNRKFKYVDGGKRKLCYSYVENLADGVLLALNSEKARGETFIITDDLLLTWRDVIESICERLNISSDFPSVPAFIAKTIGKLYEIPFKLFRLKKEPEITFYRASIVSKDFHFTCEKAKKLLGYSPTVGFHQGIAKTVEWYLSQFKN